MIEIVSLFQRLDWLSLLDILLVAGAIFAALALVRGTQAVLLLRGVIVLVISIALLSSFLRLSAFAWLLRNTLPTLVFAVPVIFAPELRRALERLGRASALFNFGAREPEILPVIEAVAGAAEKLSGLRLGGLIVVEREAGLKEYIDTGVPLDALVSVELLVQIFHVNTPLHDGAVILRGDRVAAAGCVLPLSTEPSLDKQMGLRHRAALGVSEASDAVAVVVSEETGTISITHNGRIIRRLDGHRLKNILVAFHRPRPSAWLDWVMKAFSRSTLRTDKGSAEAGKERAAVEKR
ncbi:MAG: TIGR00159 family protein [Chloroflexi bacterium]|nr:TIGR00159 family protein [Chloroflexota bacterium]MBI3760358.1 TIGR00159 family protein [Chloroflexota bacterium]